MLRVSYTFIQLFGFRKLKEQRKKQQEKNKQDKEDKKEELKKKSLEGIERKKKEYMSQNPNSQSFGNPKELEDVDSDSEWYKKEIGQDPDKGKRYVIYIFILSISSWISKFSILEDSNDDHW